MISTILFKLLPATALMSMWFWLVLTGQADVAMFISTIQLILVGLGIYNATKPGGDKP